METGSGARATAQRKQRLFGLTLASEFAFESRLEPGRGSTDLVFSSSSRAPFAARLGEPLYESPLKDDSGESLACLYQLSAAELLRFGDALDYYLGEEYIHCHLRNPACRYLVEIRLLGPVLAYWLEKRGVCTLHASAVVVDGRAVAFMATNQGGKSGLAAALMAGGDPLLTDDLLPIEALRGRLTARSGYPQMRMWPDGVSHFIGDRRCLEPVHPRLGKRRVPVGSGGFGAFHSSAVPLGCLYLPERQPPEHRSGEVRIVALSRRQAVIELFRCSFSPFIVEAVGLQPRRLELFSQLVSEVPVRRLVYPSGFDELPKVRGALLADLDTL